MSATEDFEPWIKFFAQAIKTQSEQALTKANALVETREEILGRLHDAGVRGVTIRIAEDLVGSPFMTPRTALRRLR